MTVIECAFILDKCTWIFELEAKRLAYIIFCCQIFRIQEKVEIHCKRDLYYLCEIIVY